MVCNQTPAPKGGYAAPLSIPAPCCPPPGDGHPTAAPHPAPSPQLLLARPMCIPWGMPNSEPQCQEGECHDLHFPRGKLRHKRLNNFSGVLCCRQSWGPDSRSLTTSSSFLLMSPPRASPRRDAHPGVVSNSWRQMGPNSWWGKGLALGCSHLCAATSMELSAQSRRRRTVVWRRCILHQSLLTCKSPARGNM